LRAAWSAPVDLGRSKPGDVKVAFDAHGRRFELEFILACRKLPASDYPEL
jgi:hypothetical protein